MGSTGNLSRKTGIPGTKVVIETHYRNTTTKTRMPRIRTTIANRLTWFASHDSSTGKAFARKAGTNSSSIAAAETDAGSCPGSRCSFSCVFLRVSFRSQSRQSVLPSETGNPQEAHFSTRSIASGTEAGADAGNDDTGNGDGTSGGSAGTAGGSASSGLTSPGSTSSGSTSSGSTSSGFRGTLTGS